MTNAFKMYLHFVNKIVKKKKKTSNNCFLCSDFLMYFCSINTLSVYATTSDLNLCICLFLSIKKVVEVVQTNK